MSVLRGSDLGHWDISLCPLNHIICTTPQISAPAPTLTDEINFLAILCIMIIDSNIYRMSHSSQ